MLLCHNTPDLFRVSLDDCPGNSLTYIFDHLKGDAIIATVTTVSAKPGNTANQGPVRMSCIDSAIILPHDGVAGWIPRSQEAQRCFHEDGQPEVKRQQRNDGVDSNGQAEVAAGLEGCHLVPDGAGDSWP